MPSRYGSVACASARGLPAGCCRLKKTPCRGCGATRDADLVVWGGAVSAPCWVGTGTGAPPRPGHQGVHLGRRCTGYHAPAEAGTPAAEAHRLPRFSSRACTKSRQPCLVSRARCPTQDQRRQIDCARRRHPHCGPRVLTCCCARAAADQRRHAALVCCAAPDRCRPATPARNR